MWNFESIRRTLSLWMISPSKTASLPQPDANCVGLFCARDTLPYTARSSPNAGDALSPSETPTEHFDVVVIGGGAAGLMCALTAGRRGRAVLVLEGSNRIGKKILMSGGGRCNFTNLNSTPEHFLSQNPHYCKSALARYTPYDFLALVEQNGVAYHEKAPGQLFCDVSSKQIVSMLAEECNQAQVKIRTRAGIRAVAGTGPFTVDADIGRFSCDSLVVATGGLSIPRMGASDFGLQIARQYDLDVVPTRAGLVPFTLDQRTLEKWSPLSGLSFPGAVFNHEMEFREPTLFTHRGLSGPGMLQISSFWQPGEPVHINSIPGQHGENWIQEFANSNPNKQVSSLLQEIWPKRLAATVASEVLKDKPPTDKPLAALSNADRENLHKALTQMTFYPSGTEGYKTAEVMLGGVNTDALSSKTMAVKAIPDLYMIGEVVDVTGHLGGHNFQWAWASGHCAGQIV